MTCSTFGKCLSFGTMTQQQTARLVPTWTVGDRLRKARELTGLDAVEFADAIGVHRDTVANYEKGNTSRPRRVVLNAWAARTGVDYEWLMTGQMPAAVEVPEPRHGATDSRDDRSGDTHRFAGALAVSAA